MDIISYNQIEMDSKISKFDFDKNPKLTKYISKLSDYYNKYIGKYEFPRKYEGMSKSKKFLLTWFYLEFNFPTKLHYVKIDFDTPKFEKITKDRAAKFVDKLSAIGGTMGLLTGFSIISGVEIIYFAFKIALVSFNNFRKNMLKKKIHQM